MVSGETKQTKRTLISRSQSLQGFVGSYWLILKGW